MKIANKNNIPSSLYSVIKHNTYTRKREPKLFSVTQIMNSPKYIFTKRTAI